MSETIITVEGGFDHHHPAERGTVRLTAGFQGGDRSSVVARTTQLQAAIAGEAQQLAADPANGPATWWSADRLQVWSEKPWNNQGKQLPLVYHAAVLMEVKFRDFARLADWVERLATIDGVTITGIDWALTEVTKARLTADARHRAVLDATERASSYAHSLGLSTLRPLALADPGMLGDETRPAAPSNGVAMSRSMKADAAASGLDLKPEDITISAKVHARFSAA
ncbi:SIMPL domain-containing protein [Labedella endophytica]|uniref:SIMPL domain-containing protein n=1 Tax=Labedella endophytica TaxID=1523160 RepID=A0A433JRI4_9MICO|nr:SIMPL domain-containing protein [Labedella endophytica]RUR00963.1 SIMPL domain-containing protein [Labedella endophytica]